MFFLCRGGAGNTNYFHWLFDVLPRLHLLEKNKLKLPDIFYYLAKILNFKKKPSVFST